MNQQPQMLIPKMALRFGIERENFEAVMKNVIMPKNATNAETVAFLAICDQYNLNPFLKHIHAFFDKKTDRIMPIISIDGWSAIVNDQPQYDGCEFEFEQDDEGKVTACTCRMWRKDRSRPTVITEFMVECWKNTEAWNKTPARLLRHRAFMQCGRIAFGITGGFDDDGSIIDAEAVDVTERRQQIEQTASDSPRAPSAPRKKPAAIENNAGQAMNRIRTDEQEAFTKERMTNWENVEGEKKAETTSEPQGKNTKARKEPPAEEQRQPERQQEEQHQSSDVALSRFTKALQQATDADDVEAIAAEWDIRATFTHDADALELAEAAIAKAKRRFT